MIHAIILICAATLAPADCTRETADDVIVPQISYLSHMECLRDSMLKQALSKRSMARRYVLVRCEGG